MSTCNSFCHQHAVTYNTVARLLALSIDRFIYILSISYTELIKRWNGHLESVADQPLVYLVKFNGVLIFDGCGSIVISELLIVRIPD